MAGESDILKQIMNLIGGTGGAAAVSQLNPVTAIASAIPALFQTGLGISQEIKADKLAKSTTRPVMGTPGALLESVNNARNMVGGQAPGITQAMNQLAQSNAGTDFNILQTGQGGAETLAALLARSNQGANSAMNIGAMQENYTQNAMMNLQNQLAQLQESQQAQFMYNKDEPYRNIMKASQDLHNAAPQNVQIGLNSLGGSLASMVGPMGEKLGGTANSGLAPVETKKVESVMPDISERSQRPMDFLQATNNGDATISDPDGLIQDPSGLINNGALRTGNPDLAATDQRLLQEKVDANSARVNATPLGMKQVSSLMPTIQAPQRDLTPVLGSSAKPALLGGAFGNIAKLVENLAKARNSKLDKGIDSLGYPRK